MTVLIAPPPSRGIPTSRPARPARDTIGAGFATLMAPGQVVELRIPQVDGRSNRTDSGYFDDLDALAAAAARYDGRAPAVYATLNPVNPDLRARSYNRMTTFAKHTTSDRDIVRRCWLPIDADPIRPAGVSSSTAEHDAAIARIYVIRDALRAEGWPEPIVADSGNGGHLLYPIDLAPHDDIVDRVLTACAFRFSDDRVAIDRTVGNPARIWKVYGTRACKGDNIGDRVHRVARILEAPWKE